MSRLQIAHKSNMFTYISYEAKTSECPRATQIVFYICYHPTIEALAVTEAETGAEPVHASAWIEAIGRLNKKYMLVVDARLSQIGGTLPLGILDADKGLCIICRSVVITYVQVRRQY